MTAIAREGILGDESPCVRIIVTCSQENKACDFILFALQKVLSKPRPSLSPWAPRIYTLQINPEKIGDVIGPGGKIIRSLVEKYDVLIDIEEDGKVFVTSEKEENGKKAISHIKNITREVKRGEVFQGKVKKVLDFGAFVEILSGQEGLIHISQLKKTRLRAGDIVSVKIENVDSQGRIDLSLIRTLKKS